MKVVVVDKQTFLKKPNFYVKAMQEFVPNQTEEVMLGTLNYGGFYIFVFADNGEVATWGRAAKPVGRKTLYCIRQIETKEKYRRQGYASLCYNACEEYLRETDKNIRRIYTFVDDDNEKSIRFHEKMGYEKVENVSKYLRELHGWDDAIMFEKQIERTLEKERQI